MRRLLMTLAAVVLAGASFPRAAGAQVSADINLHIGDRPAPQVVFEREPDVVLIPRTHVYCREGLDYDFFRVEGFWYINDDGYWYRAASYRGPFVAIDFVQVPRSIIVLPPRYHHHPFHPLGGPPGQMKKMRREMRYDSDHDRYRDRDRRDRDYRHEARKGGGRGRGGRH